MCIQESWVSLYPQLHHRRSLLSDSKLETDSKAKANILLEQFSSVFTRANHEDLPPVDKYVEDSIEEIIIEEKWVEGLLKKIKSSKVPGPDNIPNRVLKECASELAPSATILFQHSLNTGVLQDDSPVYKISDRLRHVSLTSVLSKLKMPKIRFLCRFFHHILPFKAFLHKKRKSIIYFV